MRLVASVVLAAALLGLVTAPSGASVVVDDDDTPGPLDIVYVQHHRARAGRILHFKIVTFEIWRKQTLVGDRRFLAVEISTNRRPNAERCIVIDKDPDADLRASVLSGCGYAYQDSYVGAARSVWRPDRHSVVVSIRRRLLRCESDDFCGKRIRHYSWRGLSSYEAPDDEECPVGGPPQGGLGSCWDRTRYSKLKKT